MPELLTSHFTGAGNIAFTGVIPGEDHLTGDLAMGLRVLEPYAEELKLEYGKAQSDPSDSEQDLWIIGNKTIGIELFQEKQLLILFMFTPLNYLKLLVRNLVNC